MVKGEAFAAWWVMVCVAAIPAVTSAQEMSFEEYTPRSTLVVPKTDISQAKFPLVDVHNHIFGDLTPSRVDSMVRAMDALNIAALVDLSGRAGSGLESKLELFGDHAGRFLVFTNLDYEGIDEPEWPERAAMRLRQDVRRGARGLKIYKRLGMEVNDRSGRVAVNDVRLDPVWRAAGDLGIPVLIHTADPAEFWRPHDRFNERWLELKERPNRKRNGSPTWEQLIDEQFDVFRKHPNTTFIAAHLAWMGNDLTRLGELLRAHPNVMTEIGAVIYDPGRQPRTARHFFTEFQDRILFGKDIWAPEEYPLYFRVLETPDEYFEYYRRRHAFWRLYGLDLADEVLRKIYYGNAQRILNLSGCGSGELRCLEEGA